MAIDHRESSVKIYATKNYSLFKFIVGNRDLNLKKINRIENQCVTDVDILKYAPIMVYEKGNFLYIVDGQHRFEVSRALKCHVWYIVVPEFSVLEITKINSNSESWRKHDFMISHIMQGNDDYKILKEINDNYGISLNAAMRLLSTGYVSRDGGLKEDEIKAYKEGGFKVIYEKETREFLDQMEAFKKFPLYKTLKFMYAVGKMLQAETVTIAELAEIFFEKGDFTKRQGGHDYFVFLFALYQNKKPHAA